MGITDVFQVPKAFTGSATATLVSRTLLASNSTTTTGAAHPPILNLALLVFEAVLEVVCVSLPGYIIARQGMFDVTSQKFVANLNVSLFTPCLIFIKLASQLSIDKLADLAIIPAIFIVQTAVSYLGAVLICKLFRLGKRARNFVVAMGVFGNSNSLPISLVMSLSMTISGLHWDRIPGDNDNDVAARGILYLLIFQQLGQLVRWSWGYHVLLAPRKANEERDDGTMPTPAIETPYRDDPDADTDSDIEAQGGIDPFESPHLDRSYVGLHRAYTEQTALLKAAQPIQRYHQRNPTSHSTTSVESGSHSATSDSPLTTHSNTALNSRRSSVGHKKIVPPASLPRTVTSYFPETPDEHLSRSARAWSWTKKATMRFLHGLWEFMNPPLWAMLIALIVASVPALQRLFFTPGTFVQSSVTRAVSQSGNVAVPLILVVLGANLANSTSGEHRSEKHEKYETKLLVAALVSRMVLPFIIMAPMLTLVAKYVQVSILDDPIFVIVCFLLVGAPSALQLAQICQINNVYENVMARILFWSYVLLVLPSTLVLVISAIEVVEWAK